METGPVNADLKANREKVLLQGKTTKDTGEWWFAAESVASAVVGEAAPRTTVRIANVVEVGHVQFKNEHHNIGLSCCGQSVLSPGKGKKRRVPASPVKSKKLFSVSGPSADRPSFEVSLGEILRNQEPEETAVIGKLSQYSERI